MFGWQEGDIEGGGYISYAGPINFTVDIHEVDEKANAKQGRIPGLTANPRLERVMWGVGD